MAEDNKSDISTVAETPETVTTGNPSDTDAQAHRAERHARTRLRMQEYFARPDVQPRLVHAIAEAERTANVETTSDVDEIEPVDRQTRERLRATYLTRQAEDT
jgi:formate dehydrogenase maturation protein FdhE